MQAIIGIALVVFAFVVAGVAAREGDPHQTELPGGVVPPVMQTFVIQRVCGFCAVDIETGTITMCAGMQTQVEGD